MNPAFDPAIAYDHIGPIRYVTRASGYVMVRRPHCIPFVMSERDWAKLPKTPEAGLGWRLVNGIPVETDAADAAKGKE